MPVLTLAQLQARLGGIIRGDAEISIHGAASLETSATGQISFVVSEKFLPQARASHASALIVPESLAALPANALPQACLLVTNPHAVFAGAVGLLHPQPESAPGIHQSACIADDAVIEPGVHIAPYVVVGAGAQIGANSQIGAHCVIGPGAHIGANSLLHPRVTVQHGCTIGERCILHPGCVIGADGFGLAWEDDHWLKVPQVGKVIVGNDVEIGANTTVDRGALDDTVIENGVKMDNLIQVGHNCRIGAHTAIAACAAIAGSTHIGAYCQIGGASMILGHIEIGDRITVSGASFIGKSIHEPGIYTSVQPQMPHAEWRKNIAHLRHLDALAKRIKQLEEKLKENN